MSYRPSLVIFCLVVSYYYYYYYNTIIGKLKTFIKHTTILYIIHTNQHTHTNLKRFTPIYVLWSLENLIYRSVRTDWPMRVVDTLSVKFGPHDRQPYAHALCTTTADRMSLCVSHSAMAFTSWYVWLIYTVFRHILRLCGSFAFRLIIVYISLYYTPIVLYSR